MRATGRGKSKTASYTTLEHLYYTRKNMPRNTPYGSSYVHGKMCTNDRIKKIEL